MRLDIIIALPSFIFLLIFSYLTFRDNHRLSEEGNTAITLAKVVEKSKGMNGLRLQYEVEGNTYEGMFQERNTYYLPGEYYYMKYYKDDPKVADEIITLSYLDTSKYDYIKSVGKILYTENLIFSDKKKVKVKLNINNKAYIRRFQIKRHFPASEGDTITVFYRKQDPQYFYHYLSYYHRLPIE